MEVGVSRRVRRRVLAGREADSTLSGVVWPNPKRTEKASEEQIPAAGQTGAETALGERRRQESESVVLMGRRGLGRAKPAN